MYANNNYVELIDYLFDKLLRANPSGEGYPCCLQRNPSLRRGSNQQLLIPPGGIKKDLNDYTISLSPLILVQYNADHDGDQLNGYLAIDSRIASIIGRLAPHTGLMDLNRANEISDTIDMPKPVTSTMDHWIFLEDLAVEKFKSRGE